MFASFLVLFIVVPWRGSLYVVSPCFPLINFFFLKGSLLWCCLISEFFTYTPAVATQNWKTSAGGEKMTSLGAPQNEMHKLTLDTLQKDIRELSLDTSQQKISNPVTPLSALGNGILPFYVSSIVLHSEGCHWELCITQVFEGECHRWHEELIVFRNCAVNKWTGLPNGDRLSALKDNIVSCTAYVDIWLFCRMCWKVW